MLRLVLMLSLVLTAGSPPLPAATVHPVTDEIEALLAYVQHLDGAVFIRNGGEHTPAEAAAHLRMKWEKQAAKVRTAEDFIALCGTKSLTSGERYRIRFKDGAARDSAAVLTERLRKLRRGPQPRP